MANNFFLSSRVIKTVRSLPFEDRYPISNALKTEFVLGADPYVNLTPVQGMLYAMIRFYVIQDSERNMRYGPRGVSEIDTESVAPSFEPCGRALG